ncbi:helix-turn-helix domain-containing protein [Frankia sp. Cj3]|uniref:helix-turn-helix domain-containing protein n=1 Tax=Frankia sp. Cj3 TaxID=2880976 RepID=UPI001EF5F75A|nr:helix-turn-helix domain-containing protein [Frankia sp. Cj3]
MPSRPPTVRTGDGVPAEHPLMTVREAARALRVSEMTIRRAIYAETIPFVAVGRAYRVPRTFITRLLDTADGGQTAVAAELAPVPAGGAV